MEILERLNRNVHEGYGDCRLVRAARLGRQGLLDLIDAERDAGRAFGPLAEQALLLLDLQKVGLA